MYGCLSNDMDMLVYGCDYVFRNMNIQKETVDVYNMKKILCTLKMSLDSFKYLCLYSNKKENIFRSYIYYNNYLNERDIKINFLEYLLIKVFQMMNL